jgi:hypothetical protein
VVAAARKIVPILVDCSEKGSQQELRDRYGVRGFPSVVYVDPEGKKLKDMGGREPKAIITDVDGLAAKFPGQASLFQNSLGGALALAKSAKTPLPVAVYFAEEGADILKVAAKLSKDLASKRSKFLFVLDVGRKTALEALGLEKAPALVVLDPTAENPQAEPLAKVPVDAAAKGSELMKALDEAAKKMKKK